jgi:hypothetical protein
MWLVMERLGCIVGEITTELIPMTGSHKDAG